METFLVILFTRNTYAIFFCGWIQNVAPNHRANDVIVLEGRPQTLVGRFMYGPLDVVSLSGEKVCVWFGYIVKLIVCCRELQTGHR